MLTTTLQRPVFVFKRPFTSVPYLISPPASDFKHRLFVPHCTSQYRILYHHQHSTLNSDSLYLTVPHSTISYITTSTQHPTLNSDSLYLTVPHSTISYITTSTQHPTLNSDSLYLTVPHSTISYITTSTQHPTLNTDSLYLTGK